MDIISMQVANKALKRLNTEYGGFCYTIVATEGQTDFTSQKPFDKEGYTLRVHVDGIRAVKDRDYTLISDKVVKFNEPLSLGEVVTLSTDIAGVPKYSIEYDDTDIKREVGIVKTDLITANEKIVAANNEIEIIKTALDEDLDGSILDTIADIKKQWADADADLKLLVDGKAGVEEIAAINLTIADITEKLNKVVQDIANANLALEAKASTEQVGVVASDLVSLTEQLETAKLDLTGQVGAVASDLAGQVEIISTTKTKVEAVEKKGLSDFAVKDEYTGRKYCLSVNNGVVVPVLNHVVMATTVNIPEQYTVNEPQEFTIGIIPNEDAGIMIKAHFTIPVGAKVEYYEATDSQWHELVDTFGPPETGFPVLDITTPFRATFTEDGTHTAKVKFNRVDNNYTLHEVDLEFKAVNPVAVGGIE